MGERRQRQMCNRDSSSSSSSSSSPYGTDPIAEACFRAFQQGRGTRFYFSGPGGSSGFGIRQPFPTSSKPPPMKPANLSFKSVYVQTVQVSLEHLDKRVEKYKFDLVDNLWTHWQAAIRGKVVYLGLYHGLIYALPLLRAREFVVSGHCSCDLAQTGSRTAL